MCVWDCAYSCLPINSLAGGTNRPLQIARHFRQPKGGVERAGSRPACRRLQALDQAGIDEQTIEAPSLGPAGARVKYATAALEDLLLLGERRVERHPRTLERDQREAGCIERIESRYYIGRHEIDGVDRVIGGQVARIACLDASCNLSLVERRIDDVHREFRLMVAVAHQKKGFAREFPFEAAEKRGIVARTHRLPRFEEYALL